MQHGSSQSFRLRSLRSYQVSSPPSSQLSLFYTPWWHRCHASTTYLNSTHPLPWLDGKDYHCLYIFLLRKFQPWLNHSTAHKVLRVWLLFSLWFLSSFHLCIPKLSEACHKFGAVSRSCLETNRNTWWRWCALVSEVTETHTDLVSFAVPQWFWCFWMVSCFSEAKNTIQFFSGFFLFAFCSHVWLFDGIENHLTDPFDIFN